MNTELGARLTLDLSLHLPKPDQILRGIVKNTRGTAGWISRHRTRLTLSAAVAAGGIAGLYLSLTGDAGSSSTGESLRAGATAPHKPAENRLSVTLIPTSTSTPEINRTTSATPAPTQTETPKPKPEPATLAFVKAKYQVKEYPQGNWMKDIKEELYYFSGSQGEWLENVVMVWGNVKEVDAKNQRITFQAGKQEITAVIKNQGAWFTTATIDPDHITSSSFYSPEEVVKLVKPGQKVDARVVFKDQNTLVATSIAWYKTP